MGGFALQNGLTRRINKIEYNSICSDICRILSVNGYIEGQDFYLIQPLNEKESFGDIDVLIKKNNNPHLGNELCQLFNPTQIKVNKPVYSFNFKECQIDFIFTKPRHWGVAKYFYDWGGIGFLLGKIARFRKLKLGQLGLLFELQHFEVTEDIEVSLDPIKIFQFFDLDLDRYNEGFNNIEEVAFWFIQSKWFSNAVFERVAVKDGQIIRDTQRPIYQEFLKHIRKVNVVLERPTVEETAKQVKDFFGVDLPSIIEKRKKEIDIERHCRFKTNGNLLMERFKISGKQLGKLINDFQNSFPTKQERIKFILEHSEEEILQYFENFI